MTQLFQPQIPNPIRLTDRDKRIMEIIHAYDGLMSRKQIDQLFFSGKGRTQVRQRLQALCQHRFLQTTSTRNRHRVPMGEVIYWLGKKGSELVAGLRGESVVNFPWRKQPRWSMIDHELRANDFRIAIETACQRSFLLTLHQWVPEGVFRSHPDKVTFRDRNGRSRSRQVIPDGFFTIRRQAQQQTEAVEEFAFLIEIDMATESNPRFAREKVRAEVAYLKSDAYRERFGVNYGAVLVVTTGMKRLNNLRQATEQAGGKGVFYFTTFERIQAGTVLDKPIWQQAGRDGQVAIIPNAQVIRRSR